MKKETALERKIEKVKQDLMKLGDMRPGSISVQTRKWGGEYGQLSYTHRGKGHTEYVPEKRRKEVERQTANYDAPDKSLVAPNLRINHLFYLV